MLVDVGVSVYIKLDVCELKLGKGKILIYTGAEISLLKEKLLKSDTLIWEDRKIKLKGIDNDAVSTET